MSFRIDGLDKLQARLEASGKDAPNRLAGGLFVEGNKIMTISKRDFVPVDKGPLRASGHVKRPVVKAKTAQVTLGYGGAAAAYALIQHERTDFRHTVGQAKYLEKPVKNAVRGFGKRIARNLDLF